MKAGKLLINAVTGTSIMTGFSYMVSASKRKNFREPELLAHFFQSVNPDLSSSRALAAGWATHYSLGIVWAIVHHLLLQTTGTRPSIKAGLSLGLFSGLVGVAVWHQLFKLQPSLPSTPLQRFYSHLMLTHLVFSLTVVHKNKEVHD
jgi:hypothetical protein